MIRLIYLRQHHISSIKDRSTNNVFYMFDETFRQSCLSVIETTFYCRMKVLMWEHDIMSLTRTLLGLVSQSACNNGNG